MNPTIADAIAFARRIAGTNSSSLTDAKGLDFANDVLYDMRKAFIKSGVDAGKIEEVSFTPTAGVGKYGYPDGSDPTVPPMFLLKAIEVNFNNTQQSNYLPATKMDVSNLPQGYSFDYMRVNQSAQNPIYDDHGDSFEIFPTPVASFSLTNAIKLIYFIQPSPYTLVSNALVFPEKTDMRILGYGIGASWLRSIFKYDEADKLESKMLAKIADTVPTFGTGGQMPTTPQSIPFTGAEF